MVVKTIFHSSSVQKFSFFIIFLLHTSKIYDVHVLKNMVEVGLVRIRYGNSSHWVGLKIIERVFSVDEFIALLG